MWQVVVAQNFINPLMIVMVLFMVLKPLCDPSGPIDGCGTRVSMYSSSVWRSPQGPNSMTEDFIVARSVQGGEGVRNQTSNHATNATSVKNVDITEVEKVNHTWENTIVLYV